MASPTSSSQFGFCVPVFAHPGGSFFRVPSWTNLDPSETIRGALLAEELGYDSLWVADHLIHGHEGGIFEGWSTLAFLAGRTRRIRLGTIHLAHFFRAPSLTAKMAATLDVLSNGRLIFFYDTGCGSPECDAYGLNLPPPGERFARLDEGLTLIRQLWGSREPLTFDGAYYRTKDAVCMPHPTQQPTPPIWLGEVRDDRWLDIVSKHATGWNSTPASVDDFRSKLDRLGTAARRAGRDLDSFELSLEIEILIRPNRASVRETMEQIAGLPPSGPAKARAEVVSFLETSRDTRFPASYENRVLIGTPEEVIDRIRAYQALGVGHFMLWFLDFPSPQGMELFASKVLPQVR